MYLSNWLIFSILFLFLLPACLPWKCSINGNKEIHDSPVVDLIDSVRIIRALVASNKIGEFLEDHDTDQLALLLDNKSPAQMAFEAEVLSTTVPLVVVYYFTEKSSDTVFMQRLEKLAFEYDNRIKFVMVDCEKLFSLAQDADIAAIPTVLFVKNREIIERCDENISIAMLEKLLDSYAIKN